jgi:Fe-S-cluster containining protein
MIEIGDTLVSTDLFDEEFVCNLSACKGACCVEGDAGAPLLDQEVDILKKELSNVLPYVGKKGNELIENDGFYEEDKDDSEYVTKCNNGKECVFLNYDHGIAKCGIELAFFAGKTEFKKPISCHLYPIRLSKVGNYTALNYHKWEICSPACDHGKSLKVSLYEFLKEPLIRAFGEDWYRELSSVAMDYIKYKNGDLSHQE